jgi:hypothetical protein
VQVSVSLLRLDASAIGRGVLSTLRNSLMKSTYRSSGSLIIGPSGLSSFLSPTASSSCSAPSRLYILAFKGESPNSAILDRHGRSGELERSLGFEGNMWVLDLFW